MRDDECERPVPDMPEAEAPQFPGKLHRQHLMAAMRFEGLDDFPVQGFVRAVEAEMIPKDGDVHECPARFEYATDFRQRGIDVGDVFQRLGGGCGVTGRVVEAGVVSQPFQKRDIGKFAACRLGLHN